MAYKEILKEIYEGIEMKIRSNEGMYGDSENMEIRKEVRQNCVLSPLLFKLQKEDLDNYMKNEGVGGIQFESLGVNKEERIKVIRNDKLNKE